MNIKTYGVIVTYKPDIIVLEDCINSHCCPVNFKILENRAV